MTKLIKRSRLKPRSARGSVKGSEWGPDSDLLQLPEYKILEDYFFKCRPNALTSKSGLSKRGLAYYDQFYWNPLDLRFVSDRSTAGRPSTDPYLILHSSLHHLLVSAFSPGFRERPQFTLMCEALVSLLELYFPCRLLHENGARSRTDGPAQQMLELLQVGSERLKITDPLRRKKTTAFVENAVNHPFEAYKNAFGEMVKVYDRLLAVAIRRKNGRGTDLEKLHQEMKRFKNIQIIYGFQTMNNVVFALAFCGAKSSVSDKKEAQRLYNLVKSSQAMEMFLFSLIELVAKKRGK